MQKNNLLAAAISAVACAATTSSLAQSQDDENVQPNFALEEVVVTAQKRSQNAQDVPIALVSVGEDMVKQMGASDFKDLSHSIPGLSVSGSSQGLPSPYIRGIGSNDVGVGSDPSIGVYIDGVYSSRSGGALGELLDVASVEVLKGPQGTLFGRNSVGGAISIKTNKPSEDLEGSLGVEAGNYGAKVAKAIVNVPLIDNTLMMRASAVLRKRDGWQDNLVNKQKTASQDKATGSLRIRYLPTDDLEVELINSWNRVDEAAPLPDNLNASVPLREGSSDLDDTNTVNGGQDLFGNPAFSVAPLSPKLERNLRSHALHVNWDISEDYSLHSLSSYRTFNTATNASYDGSEFFVGHLEDNVDYNESVSQEFRLNGQSESTDWFIGASYAHERNNRLITLGFFDFLRINRGAPVYEHSDVSTSTDSWAIYGDIAWHINDKATLTFGGRYSLDKKDISYNNPIQTDSFLALSGLGVILPTRFQFVDEQGQVAPHLADLNDEWNDFSPRLVFDYALNDDVLLYASVSRGFKSGAFNSFPAAVQVPTSPNFLRVVPQATQSVSPEIVNNYELGMKTVTLDGRLRVNGSIYQYQYEDLQVFSTNGAVVQLTNAGEASSTGVELDSSFQVSENLRVSMSMAWSDASYDQFVSNGRNLAGTPLLFSPEWSGSFNVDYSVGLDNGGEIRAFAALNYRGDHLLDEDYLQKSYTIASARVSYYSPSADWSLALFGNNLGNTSHGVRYIDQAAAFSGFTSLYRNEPRTWGLALDYNF